MLYIYTDGEARPTKSERERERERAEKALSFLIRAKRFVVCVRFSFTKNVTFGEREDREKQSRYLYTSRAFVCVCDNSTKQYKNIYV